MWKRQQQQGVVPLHGTGKLDGLSVSRCCHVTLAPSQHQHEIVSSGIATHRHSTLSCPPSSRRLSRYLLVIGWPCIGVSDDCCIAPSKHRLVLTCAMWVDYSRKGVLVRREAARMHLHTAQHTFEPDCCAPPALLFMHACMRSVRLTDTASNR